MAAAFAPPAAAQSTPVVISSRVSPRPIGQAVAGVVTIFAGESMGSGVVVSDDGYVLTNQHVVGDAAQVRLRLADGSSSTADVVRTNRRRDVALIKASKPMTALPIRTSAATTGETVYAIGTPREKEFAGTLTRGIVSAADRVLEGQSYIQSDVAITHGNSGGPLLDEKGAVIGLSQSAYEPDGVGQNINFFVPINDALRALNLKRAD